MFLGRFRVIDLIPEGNRLLTHEKRNARCEPATLWSSAEGWILRPKKMIIPQQSYYWAIKTERACWKKKKVNRTTCKLHFASLKDQNKSYLRACLLFKQLIMKRNRFRQTIDESKEMTLVYSYPAELLLTVKMTRTREFEIAISRNLWKWDFCLSDGARDVQA